MSSELYAEMQQVCVDMLTEFGYDITTNTHVEIYDEVSGNASMTTVPLVRKGFLTDIQSRLVSEVRMIGNSNIMTTDEVVVFGPDGDTDEHSQILIDGITYQVIKAFPIKPAGIPLLYKIVVRR